MNNKGWGIPEMLILSSLILFALIIAAINVKRFEYNTGIDDIDIVNDDSTDSSDKKDDETYYENDSSNSDSPVQETDEEDYIKLKDKMVEAAQKYIETNYSSIDNIIIIVDKKHLLEFDSEISEEMSKDNCNGYVSVSSSDINYLYVPYLKCDSYATENYNSSYE